jgi:hypothetical protein
MSQPRPATRERVAELKRQDPNYTDKLPVMERTRSGRFYQRTPSAPNGKYLEGQKTFIRTPSDKIKIGEDKTGEHARLSGDKPVKFAGEANFNNGELSDAFQISILKLIGKLQRWDNNSGTYLPSPSMGRRMHDVFHPALYTGGGFVG